MNLTKKPERCGGAAAAVVMWCAQIFNFQIIIK